MNMETYMVHPDAVMMSKLYDGMMWKSAIAYKNNSMSTKTKSASHFHKSITPTIMLICRLRIRFQDLKNPHVGLTSKISDDILSFNRPVYLIILYPINSSNGHSSYVPRDRPIYSGIGSKKSVFLA